MSRYFACAKPGALLLILIAVITILAPSRLRAQSGPVFNPASGHWYEVVTVGSGITWTSARSDAAARKFQGVAGYLATPSSAEEKLWVVTNLPSAASGQFWLGGMQPPGSPEPAGGWQWVTGEAWSYTDWGSSQPDDPGAGGLAFKSGGKWEDAPQNSTRGGYVVEYGTTPPVLPPITFAQSSVPVASPGEAASFDFDQDGNPDLAVGSLNPALEPPQGKSHNNDVVLLYGHGDGTFDAPVFRGLGVQPTQIVATDVNGDGKPDLVTSGGDSLFVQRSLGGRTYAPAARYTGMKLTQGFQPVDLNGDYRPELVAADTSNDRITVLLNNGNGVFSVLASYPTGKAPYRPASADWNRDGRQDVAVANQFDATVSVFLGNGTGALISAGSIATNGGLPTQLVTRDFDSDGLLDLVVSNYGAQTIGIMFGNGNGTFRPSLTYPAGTFPSYFQAPDLDGDGDPDLAIPNDLSVEFTVIRNNGGVPGPALTFPAGGAFPQSVAVGDFNRDSRPDLAVSCLSSHAVTLFLNTTLFPPPGTPGNLTATPVSANLVHLSWQDTSFNETGFVIERNSGAGWGQVGTAPIASDTGSTVEYLDSSSLQPGTQYSYRVRATNSSGNSAYSNVATVTTFPNPPGAPTNLQADAVSYSQVNLTWIDNSPVEEGFEIERKIGDGVFAPVAAVGANVTSYADTAVVELTTYSYRVRASNSGGTSGYSNEALTVTPPQPTPAPSKLVAGAVSSTEVRLAWQDNSKSETAFKIERKPAGGAFSQIAMAGPRSGSGGTVIYPDNSGLSPNSSYTYRVRATGPGGESSFSNEADVTTIPLPPSAPTSLTVAVTSASTVLLSWNDTSNNETGFKIERKVGTGSFTFIGQGPADSATFPDAGLTVDTTYTYRVRASGTAGNSGLSNEASASTPPVAPSGLTASGATAGQVVLAWTDTSQTETGFKIERRVGGNFAPLATAPAGSTGYTDSGLSPHTTYSYRVRATNGGGDSPYSNEASALTLPAAPSGLTVTTASANQLELSWTDNNPSPPAVKIERSTDGGFNFTQVGSTAGGITSYRDSGLSAVTTYHYRVRASNATGNSGYSGTVSGITLPLPPAAPGGLTAVAQSATSVLLTWQDNSGNESGFEVYRLGSMGGYQLLSTTASNATTYLDSTAQGSTNYNYRVRAINAGGASTFTSVVSVTTPAELPPTPGSPAAMVLSSTQVRLTWTDASALETGFRIERKQAGGAFVEISITAANATEYVDTGLSEGTAYTYRLAAVGSSGSSPVSGEITATTLLGTPGPLIVTAAANRINLAWQDQSTHENGYQVERKTAGGSFTVLATLGAGVTAYADTAVTPETTYTYRVQATGGGNSSAYSNESSAAPLRPTPLAKLVISPTKVNFGTVKLGANKLKTIKLTNKGKEALSAIVGTATAPFTLVSGGGSVTLAPKQTVVVTLRFTPSAAGSAAASLRITSTVPATPQTDVALTGKGK